jgi:hypothetical protein
MLAEDIIPSTVSMVNLISGLELPFGIRVWIVHGDIHSGGRLTGQSCSGNGQRGQGQSIGVVPQQATPRVGSRARGWNNSRGVGIGINLILVGT